MIVGFFSPLPPARTGVADYAAALLPALRSRCEVAIGPDDADVFLYHLGNNALHAGIYRRALERPGVAVLHDAVLHHMLLGSLSREAYIEEFVYNYGEFRREQALALWEARGRSSQDPRYFDHAMVRRVAEASRAVVVHNRAAAGIVTEHAPGTRIEEIEHLFAPVSRLTASEVLAWRSRNGLGPETFLFGIFGHLRESKRLHSALCAFNRMRLQHGGAALLVAGDFVSRDLERDLEPLLASPGVLRVPYCSEPEFWTLASAVDACINLRYPSAGETSGITIRLMGIGKPVLVSAGEETSRLPEGSVIRIDRGVAEQPMLAEYMKWLAACPERAREIGARAAAHIAAHHSPEMAACRYFELLSSCCR